MKKVNVLLSTYNGEKYLQEQIESLLKQSYSNIDIYIYDDGSQDNTREIINKYVNYSRNGKTVYFIEDSLHLGYPACFIHLLKVCKKADYYAFCDQDDVWLNTKVERAVDALNDYSVGPLLYYSAVNYCDSELNFIRKSRFADKEESCSKMPLQKMLLGGEAMGMTYCFNEETKNVLLNSLSETNRFKDIFLKIYCATCGTVIYDSKPSANYRRHEGAVTNSTNPSGNVQRYVRAISDLFFSNDTNEHIRIVINYVLKNGVVSQENKKLLQLFSVVSFDNQIKKIFWKRRFRKIFFDEIGYRIAFILGKL